MTINTTASIKKITSGKGVEIVLSLPSSVSLDDLNELKQRDEFYLALGVSQMEIRDYIEPRRGYQARVDGTGVVESVTNPEDGDGKQLEIGDVATEQEEVVQEEQSESKEGETSEGVVDTSESSEQQSNEEPPSDKPQEEDPDAPIVFDNDQEELPF